MTVAIKQYSPRSFGRLICEPRVGYNVNHFCMHSLRIKLSQSRPWGARYDAEDGFSKSLNITQPTVSLSLKALSAIGTLNSFSTKAYRRPNCEVSAHSSYLQSIHGPLNLRADGACRGSRAGVTV